MNQPVENGPFDLDSFIELQRLACALVRKPIIPAAEIEVREMSDPAGGRSRAAFVKAATQLQRVVYPCIDRPELPLPRGEHCEKTIVCRDKSDLETGNS